jgi:uncharacterized protein (DUF2345 family)
MAGDIIGTTTYTGVNVSSGGSITLPSGTSLVAQSGATVAWLPGAHFSMATIGAASSLASLTGTGMQIGLFFAASGLSLVCRSGNSLYYFNSAASGAAP